MSRDTKPADDAHNDPVLKGEAPAGVAVLAVRDDDDDDDSGQDDDGGIDPQSPIGGVPGHSGWRMRSARSSIERPRSYIEQVADASSSPDPPPSLDGASRSYYTSQSRANIPIQTSHIVDLTLPRPPAGSFAGRPTYADELDAEGGRVHVYFSSRHERVKAAFGIVGRDDLKDGEKHERVRIVCKSEHSTVGGTIAQRYPPEQPFTIAVSSVHQSAFLVLPRSFRGPAHLTATSGTVNLSPGVGAAYTHVSKQLGFIGPATGWSGEPSRAGEEGLDECFAHAGGAGGRVHVRFEDEEDEDLDPLEEAAKKVEQAAKAAKRSVAKWFQKALEI